MSADVKPGRGDCYQVAAELTATLARRGIDVRCCHGTPVLQSGEFAGQRYGHAWVEALHDGQWLCIDRSNGNSARLPRREYYRLGQLQQHHVIRYTATEMLRHITSTEHWGPWNDLGVKL